MATATPHPVSLTGASHPSLCKGGAAQTGRLPSWAQGAQPSRPRSLSSQPPPLLSGRRVMRPKMLASRLPPPFPSVPGSSRTFEFEVGRRIEHQDLVVLAQSPGGRHRCCSHVRSDREEEKEGGERGPGRGRTLRSGRRIGPSSSSSTARGYLRRPLRFLSARARVPLRFLSLALLRPD